MPYKINFSTGKFDYYEKIFQGVLASAPSSPQEGWTYINSGDNGYYIYYAGSWQLLHTLTPAAASYRLLEDGSSFRLLEDGVSKRLLG